MRRIVNLGKPTLIAILLAAPIGNTTILLLFSLSLETLLTLLLLRERSRRLGTAAVPSEAPVTLLCRTVPHLRSRRPTSIQVGIASSRWRTAVGEATSYPRGNRAASGPAERHVSLAGL
jgi:hypothetical protein